MELTSPANEAEEPSDDRPWSLVPPVPTSVSATDIPEPFLQELMLKALRAYEKPTAVELSRIVALHSRVVDEILNPLKSQGLCEIEAGSGVQFRYRLSEAGKKAADEALQRSRYVGAAPVSVRSYNAAIAEQITRFMPPPLDRIRDAVRHMVLADELVEDIGQAFFSRRTLMIYGPSGNGKTDIVTSIARTVAGTVIVPHALYGHGQLIHVFDPDVHKSAVGEAVQPDGIRPDEAARHDRRWLPVSRPIVVVGGEIGMDSLEMHYDAMHGVHTAPLSIVAQGGVLVIDDLGRQKASTEEILNRWVLMMAQGYDSFALASSEIVRLPLDVTLVFSTNLSLGELMDEAYLRRIAYKIQIKNPCREELAEITRRSCREVDIPFTEQAVEHLMQRLYAAGEPRGCYPRDIIATIMNGASFRGREAIFDRESIDKACDLYLGDRDTDAAAAA